VPIIALGRQMQQITVRSHNMRKYLSGLIFGALLIAPAAIQADEKEHHDNGKHKGEYKRYYDDDRKDYHQWNKGEDKAYEHYRKDQRKEQWEHFHEGNRIQQNEYWRWRHDHPNSVIFPR